MFVDMQFRISVQLMGLQMANTDINISREITESQYDSYVRKYNLMMLTKMLRN